MAILGIDEVGRGPWAGPLVVGAVVLPDDFDTAELTDSKKLTAKSREYLSQSLFSALCDDGSNVSAEPRNDVRDKRPREVDWANIPSVGLGWVHSTELDEVGLSTGLKLATRRAVKQIQVPFHEIVIDGTVNFLRGTKLEEYVTTLPKADALIPAVSAASIVAKVARDKYMAELATSYPEYGFESHVGYGTAQHRQAIERFGLTPEHRRGFKPIAKYANNTTTTGKRAESLVAKHLESKGHTVITQNWRGKTCEIDVVSQHKDKIYFTEVKYRKTTNHGSGMDAIDAAKQKQLTKSAETYLHLNRVSLQPCILCASVHGDEGDRITIFKLS